MAERSPKTTARYELLQRIGVGGMGSVYRARHLVTHEIGALKVLHAHRASDPRSVLRFLREARTVSLVKSRHIVQVKDAGGLTSKSPFIFMELLRGFTLKQLIGHTGPLGLALTVQFARQAALGLAAAHAAGIVHRDVKPENLFLATDGGSELPVLKLLDFGISKLDARLDSQTALTRQGAPLGTPGYMAPEQFYDSANVDERADVYALGVVVYECLTGRRPFVAATLRQQFEAVHKGELPALDGLAEEPGRALHGVLDRALRVSCDERYATVLEFGDALSALVGSEERALEDWRARPVQQLVRTSPDESPDGVERPHAFGSSDGGSDDSAEARSAAFEETTVVPWVSWEDLGPGDGVAARGRATRPRRASPPSAGRLVVAGVLIASGFAVASKVWKQPARTTSPTQNAALVRASTVERSEARLEPRAADVRGSWQRATATVAAPSATTVSPAAADESGQSAVTRDRPRSGPATPGPHRTVVAVPSASTASTTVVEGRFGTRFVREFE